MNDDICVLTLENRLEIDSVHTISHVNVRILSKHLVMKYYIS